VPIRWVTVMKERQQNLENLRVLDVVELAPLCLEINRLL
jgi:hypothetical protein